MLEHVADATLRDPELLALPWHLPLEEWPGQMITALPRGISRHVVRFIRLDNRIVAVKEMHETAAFREFNLLHKLESVGAPSVHALGVVSSRKTAQGQDLPACLVTDHLSFCLPYRAIFSQHHGKETVRRLVGGIVDLLVRLHMLGFFWGDMSLSNVLFRRDAGYFAAYLVDAETGEFSQQLPTRKREYDVDIARTNIIGELMDLQAGGILPPDFHPLAIGDAFARRYYEQWYKVQGTTFFHAVPRRARPGFYAFKVEELTGLRVEENQARRILNDIEEFSSSERERGQTSEQAASDWMREVYNPMVAAIPDSLREKLEPAEVFHELLEHRWFISQQQQRNVPQQEAIASFIDNVLRYRPDESTIFGDDFPHRV